MDSVEEKRLLGEGFHKLVPVMLVLLMFYIKYRDLKEEDKEKEAKRLKKKIGGGNGDEEDDNDDDEDDRAVYSQNVIRQVKNTMHMGVLDGTQLNVGESFVESLKEKSCSDVVQFYVKVDSKVRKREVPTSSLLQIEDVKFETSGSCYLVTRACCSTAAELIKGESLLCAKKLSSFDIELELSLPRSKRHCSKLAIAGLRAAISNFEAKKSQ